MQRLACKPNNYGCTEKFIWPAIPVVGSSATTVNVSVVAEPDVVVSSPLLESMLTSEMDRGFVLQVTELVISNC